MVEKHTIIVHHQYLFLFLLFLDPPGDPGKKSLSSIHFCLCSSPSAKRSLGVDFALSV